MMAFAFRFPRLRRPRKILLGALLLLAAASVRAEEAPAEPPRLLIEKISVEGTRPAAARIIKAETLLREGQVYTEDELRQAVYRVHRLPFVLDATFSLRKGTERGAYELVIQAEQAGWFFYDHSIRFFSFGERLNLEGSYDDKDAITFPGLIGGRLFVGRSGVLFGTLDSQEGAQIGYTQYNLFGRGILASASYSRPQLCCTREAIPLGLDPGFITWSWYDSERMSFTLAVPLRANQSLQLGWSRRTGQASHREEILGPFDFATSLDILGFRLSDDPLSASRSDLAYSRTEAKWVYDTSDDPLLPTRGLTLTAGLEHSTLETGRLIALRFPTSNIDDRFEEELPPYDASALTVSATATRHWSVTPRQTVSLHGGMSLGRSSIRNLPTREDTIAETDLDLLGGSVGLGHALRLWRSRGERGVADLRLETGVELGLETWSPDLGLPRSPEPLERLQLSTGLVFRNKWGRLRLNFTYLDLGEVLQ